MPKGSTTRSAGYFIDQVMKSIPGLNQPENQVYILWPQIIGESLVDEVQLIQVDQGVLLLKCTSAARKTELNFQKNAILSRANQLLGRELIRGIRFI